MKKLKYNYERIQENEAMGINKLLLSNNFSSGPTPRFFENIYLLFIKIVAKLVK